MAGLSHLNALRALEASVRLGSFKAAAGELGVTPAAVGQLVRGLEAALGQRLLTRRANRLEVTPVALLASEKLAAGFDNLREALSLMTPGEATHRLSVSVNPTIAERWLTPRLSNFLTHNPEIDLRIDSTSQLVYKGGREFDFVLRYAPPSRSVEDETKLFGEILIPVCAPSITSRFRSTDSPDALVDVPLLRADRSTSDPEWIEWEEWGERFGYTIPRATQGLQFTRTTVALRALFDGHGLFLGQLSILLADLSAGRLVAPFGASNTVRTGFPYRLIFTGPGPKTPLQRAFISWITAEAESTSAAMAAYLAGERAPILRKKGGRVSSPAS